MCGDFVDLVEIVLCVKALVIQWRCVGGASTRKRLGMAVCFVDAMDIFWISGVGRTDED